MDNEMTQDTVSQSEVEQAVAAEETTATEQVEQPSAENGQKKSRLKPTSKFLVGYWHYGVILTYMSLALSICGICFAAAYGGPRRDDLVVLFILLAGLCDSFDGSVARTRKNRTTDDKLFGMNIDTLSDMISFGIAPIMVGVAMGMTRWYYCIIYIYFVLCGLIRLAYFDVEEVKLVTTPNAPRRTHFSGLPIAVISLALPVFYLISTMFDNGACGVTVEQAKIIRSVLMMSCYVICGSLFIIRFKMPKLRTRGLIVTAVVITVTVVVLALIRYYVCGVAIFTPLESWDPQDIYGTLYGARIF